MEKTHLIVLDTIPILYAGIAHAIQETHDIEIECEIVSKDQLATAIRDSRPDVVIIDAGWLGHEAAKAVYDIKQLKPDISFVALVSTDADKEIPLLLNAGVSVIFTHELNTKQLTEAVRCARIGMLAMDPRIGRRLIMGEYRIESNQRVSPHRTLTQHEMKTLKMVVAGLTNQDIALESGIKVRTVKSRLESIYSKLGVDSRWEAALIALKRGWMSLDQVKIGDDRAYREDEELDTFNVKERHKIDLHIPSVITSLSTGILDEISEGCFLLRDGKYLYANQRMAEMLGYSRGELVGRAFTDFLPILLREPMLKLYQRRLAGEDVPTNYVLMFLKKDRSTIRLQIAVRLINFQGTKTIVGVVSDPRTKTMDLSKVLRWVDNPALTYPR